MSCPKVENVAVVEINKENIAATENTGASESVEKDSAKQTEIESKSEETIYLECDNYLTNGLYPLGASKREKAIIRKRAKNFQRWMEFSTTEERMDYVRL